MRFDELKNAAHKQGFASLAEVEKAILEPDGSLSFLGKQPEPEIVRHQELLHKIENLNHEWIALRGEMEKRPAR